VSRKRISSNASVALMSMRAAVKFHKI